MWPAGCINPMRILLAAPHRYPAYTPSGSGLCPRAYPSGSAYHLHDLLAKGLAENGHQVFYHLGRGHESELPDGVIPCPDWREDVDLYHSLIGAAGFAESVTVAAEDRRKPCLLTCHMKEASACPAPNWIFVSRSLARAHGSDRAVLNGIDPADLIYSETKQDYFLFMGAMHRAIDKGLVFALSLCQRAGCRLIVAGTGMDWETVEQIASLCKTAGAEYVGDVRGVQKAELLAGAKAVLFPSRLHEGCPLVLLEAMMSGTPAISARSGGTQEIVSPDTGILCGLTEDWTAALDQVRHISPRRCRQVAMEKFHYRRMTNDYLREYRLEIDGFRGR